MIKKDLFCHEVTLEKLFFNVEPLLNKFVGLGFDEKGGR